MTRKKLRQGFTTGSAAAAGAKAALLYLAGQRDLRQVDIPLPGGGRLIIPVEGIEKMDQGAKATIIKDAGDDPDVTHKARIRTTVRLLMDNKQGEVTIDGGKGVGRVTRPGLPVPIGEAAINPVPRRQINEAVQEGLMESGLKGSVSVTIEVVNGEKIAEKTFNPRLGIIGGISILGTRGTVKPLSNKAYKDTITLSMDVAKAEKMDMVALSTGGKSEGFLKKHFPGIPDVAFIQVGDFFSFSLKQADKRGFGDILYACFFGKLIKMAQGDPYIHARKSQIDFDLLARWCASLGMEKGKVYAVKKAHTAREVLDLIKGEDLTKRILHDMVKMAVSSARQFAGPSPNISYYLFDLEGSLLASHEDRGNR
ncbi:MAG TPA: cobalt-precorrin-5B (C(1))-methyltransferase [Desulfobacterales bacterium]|nr:cobalt-precorrin-5B (C(1))-methyltransferase [Desulfobacterales bacterium]